MFIIESARKMTNWSIGSQVVRGGVSMASIFSLKCVGPFNSLRQPKWGQEG